MYKGQISIGNIRNHYLDNKNILRRIRLYNERFTGELAKHNFQKIVQLLAPYRTGEFIADTGCGFGYLLHFLPKDVNVCAIDISNLALNIAKSFRHDLTPLLSDAHELPFRDNSFDKLFCINLTPHLLDVEKALREFYRILKQKGLAIINFLNKFGLANIHFTVFGLKFGYYFNQGIMTPSPQNNFTYKEMCDLISEVGFKILGTYGWGISSHLFDKNFLNKTIYFMKKFQNCFIIKHFSNSIIFKLQK